MKNNMIEGGTAVSSVVDVAILLTITLVSIGIMLLYMSPAITDMQDMAKSQKVEQAFTVLDSRTSKAALGESPTQNTKFSMMGGNLRVLGDVGSYNDSRIMIISLSESSSWYDSFYQRRGVWNAWKNYQQEPDFAGFMTPMGKVQYNSGDRSIAYEGGGVWAKYPRGGTTMVSPPEFNYNGETLTLPIMKINGNTALSGRTDANINIRSSNIPGILYPNTSINSNFINPVNCDKLIIYINSDFYEGWGQYAQTLTSTNVILDHRNKTAIIELDTKPQMGTFQLPSSFKVGKLNQSNPEPVYDFEFFLEATEKDAANFNPAGMTYTATSGTKIFQYELKKSSKLYITATYEDTSIGKKEIWTGVDEIVVTKGAHKKKANTTVDLVSNTYKLEYDKKSDTEFSWDEVSPTTMTPNLTISKGEIQSVNNVTQHYMKLLALNGPFVFHLGGQYKHVDLGKSTLTLNYDSGSGIITYLHVTRNELNVTVN